MAVYVIIYDLNNRKDYPKLYDAIKSAGTNWCHALDSTWFIVSTAGSVAIRDYLRRATDSDDSLFVGLVGSDAAWAGLQPDVSAWLKANL
jgi:hypothetical protein